MPTKSSLLTIRPRRSPPILICKKCLGRIDDGKQLRKTLKSEAKRRSVAQNVKPPRVLLTNCLGICPKRAVVIASGATLARGEYVLVGDSDAAADAAAILMPEMGKA